MVDTTRTNLVTVEVKVGLRDLLSWCLKRTIRSTQTRICIHKGHPQQPKLRAQLMAFATCLQSTPVWNALSHFRALRLAPVTLYIIARSHSG